MTLSIALIGYGKMGKEIGQIAKQRGHTLAAIIDPFDPAATSKTITAEALKGVHVAIDFTHPDALLGNVRVLAQLKIPMVIGTTGWYQHMDEVKALISKNHASFLWASNFSIGVNLFYRIVSEAAEIMNTIPEYDVYLHEFHHNQKEDSPSGTAKSLAQILLDRIERKTEILTAPPKGKIAPNQLHVTSTRVGSIPGTHTIGFDCFADTIELTHTARTRSGFALGAVMAAEWLHGKTGFYTIDDLMNTVLTRTSK